MHLCFPKAHTTSPSILSTNMSLETHANSSTERNIDALTHALVLVPPDQKACPVCFEPWNTRIGCEFGTIVQTQCEHVFHRACLGAWFHKQDIEATENTCPCCRTICFPILRQPAYEQQHLLRRNRNPGDMVAPQSSNASNTGSTPATPEEICRRLQISMEEIDAQYAQICTMGRSRMNMVTDQIMINRVKLDRIR